MQLSLLDLANAFQYAKYYVSKHYHEKYLQSHPHIFKYVDVVDRPATMDDFYIPPKIKDKCRVFQTSFTQMGCEKIACFSKKQNTEDCLITELTRPLHTGTTHTFACQPACFHITRNEYNIDTDYRQGRCLLANPLKKLVAVYPEIMDRAKYQLPVHTGLTLADGQLHLNERYCRAYGLDFEDGDCISSTGQTIAEYLTSTTVYRSIKKLDLKRVPKRRLPPVPDHFQNVHNWAEGVTTRSSRNVAHLGPVERVHDIPATVLETALEMAKNFAFDQGFDLSVKTLQHSLKKLGPKLLARLSKQISSRVASSAMAAVLVDVHTRTATLALRGLATSLQVATGVFAVYGIVTTVLDVLDVGKFNQVLSKYQVNVLNDKLDGLFHSTSLQWEVEVTPAGLIAILEPEALESVVLYAEYQQEYLDALEVNAKGEMLERHEKHKQKPNQDWFKVWQSLMTLCVLVFSVFFLEQLHCVLLFYFLFVLFIPRLM